MAAGDGSLSVAGSHFCCRLPIEFDAILIRNLIDGAFADTRPKNDVLAWKSVR
jgi:hypothetical protein